MSQIEITCIDQTSIFTNTPEIFSGDVNVDTVKFKFDDSWDDYVTKTAVFYNNPKEVYTQILNESYVAVIPKEVMTNKCKLSIGVFGTNVNGDVKTSKILTYNIGKGAISDDLGTNPPTLDIWVQLLTRQTIFEDKMQSEFDELESEVDTLESIALGRNQALAYNGYSEMITALNSMSADELKRGQNIYIATLGVPDLWVYGVEETNVEYTYVDDDTFVEGLNVNTTVQVGYYKLAQLETQKVDVGGITNAIDNLENDVDDLKNKPCDNVVWNRNDTLRVSKTKITDLPELPSGSGSITGITSLEHEGTLYVLIYESKNGTHLYKYDGSWEHLSTINDAVLRTYYDTNTNVIRPALCFYRGYLYVTGNTSSNYSGLFRYNTLTATALTRIGGDTSTSGESNRCAIMWVDDNSNKLYILQRRNSNIVPYYTSSTSTSDLSSTSATWSSITPTPLFRKNCVKKDGIAYVCSNTTLYKFPMGSYGSPTEIERMPSFGIRSINIAGDYFYGLTDACNYTLVKNNIQKIAWNDFCANASLGSYQDKAIELSGSGMFEIKFYTEATAYAPKGAKLYLPSNYFAISDNLQAVQDYYIVTETGEVKIGNYE